MSIRLKIVMIFIISAFIPFLAIGSLLYLDLRDSLERSIIDKIDTLATVQKRRVVELLAVKKNQLHHFVTKESLLSDVARLSTQLVPGQDRESVDKDIEAEVQQIVTDTQTKLDAKEVSVFNLKGDIIISTDPSLVGSQHADDEVFVKGKEREDISILIKDTDGHVWQYLVGPLQYQGAVVGVAAIMVDTEELFDLFHDYTGLGNTGDWGLAKKDVNGDALIIVPKRIDTDPRSPLEARLSKDNIYAPVIQGLMGKEQVFTDSIDYRGVPVLAVTRYIPDLEWMIGVTIDKSEAYSVISDLSTQLVFFGGLLLVFIIFLGSFLSQTVTRPIQKLSQTATLLQRGNFNAHVTIHTHDEIGTLGKIFNEMASRLKASYEHLEEKVKEKTKELGEKVDDLEKTKRAMVNVLEDLNVEKQKAEQEKVKDEAILASIGDGLVATDPEGYVLVMNTAAETMLGFRLRDFKNKRWNQVVKMEDAHGQPIPQERRPLSMALAQNKRVLTMSGSYDYFLRKDGSKFPVVVTTTPVMLQGQLIGGIEIFKDSTLEQKIDRTKSEFVTLASHQLRTPLTAISWFTEMLLSGDSGVLTEEQRDHLQQIYLSNQRMVSLVSALLNVSRIELDSFPITPKMLDIVSIGHKIFQDEFAKVSQDKVIRTKETYDRNVPALLADEDVIRAIFQNLISNAFKYTPTNGDVALSIYIDKKKIEKQSKGSIVIEVKDTGYGIAKTDHDKIFTKLFRGDNIKEKDTDGTGLGLFVVKSLVERVGGKIWLESEKNKGSTFFVALPLEGMQEKTGQKKLVLNS